ncbi:MAG: energy transducer TonB [Planctomycetes bacterium]|nr:energy transducer TonB [Planctomycetota bacterium]
MDVRQTAAKHPRRDPAEISPRTFPLFVVVSLVLHGAAVGGLAAYGIHHGAFAAEEPVVAEVEEEETFELDLRTYRAPPLPAPEEPRLTVQDAPEPEVALDVFDFDALPPLETLRENVGSTVVASSAPPVLGEPSPEVAWIGVGPGAIPKLERKAPVTFAGGSGTGDGSGGSPDGVDGTTGGAGAGSEAGTGLRVSVAPPPPDTPAVFLAGDEPTYPKISRRLNEEGSVVLRVAVDATGVVTDVRVQTSSGYPRLDEAAIEAVKRWRYTPATRGGVAVATILPQRVTFRLIEEN